MTGKSLMIGTATLLLLWSAAASAEMYKWTDADGSVHYTETPPPDRPATTIAPPPPPATQPAASAAPANGDKAGADGKAPPPAADNALAAKEAEARKKNCEAGRKNLDVYTNYRRVMVDGQVQVLGDDTRAKGIAAAKKTIEENCDK